MSDSTDPDGASAVVLLVGFYEGVISLAATAFGFGPPFLAFPAKLDGPWSWLIAAVVIVVAVALLEMIDQAKKARSVSA